MNKACISNENFEPLLSTNHQTTAIQKSNAKLTGSFNALIPNIQKIAKKFDKQTNTKNSPKNIKK